jgi:spermidine synthase
MAAMTGSSLEDRRVAIRVGDVADAIAGGRNQYDAILLDVDNGPDGLVRAENNRLYSGDGLAAAQAALRAGGILAVWSAGSDPAFTRRLRDAGFFVDEQIVRARQNGKGPRHTIWFATPRRTGR